MLLADRSTVVIFVQIALSINVFAQIIANLPFSLLQLLNSADLLSQRPRLQLVCDGPGLAVGNEFLYSIPLVFMMRSMPKSRSAQSNWNSSRRSCWNLLMWGGVACMLVIILVIAVGLLQKKPDSTTVSLAAQ